MRFVKTVTSKPVVGVGRFTSPDTMVSQIRRGVLDFIGAARPSIADPFLPSKIDSGDIDDIRECIGCNVCVTGDYTMTPIRCTQNPTMGEEWRKGWHPERVPPRSGRRLLSHRRRGPERPRVRAAARTARLYRAPRRGRRGARRTRDARVAPAWACGMGASARLSGEPTEQDAGGLDSPRQPGDRGADHGVRARSAWSLRRAPLATRRHRPGQRTRRPRLRSGGQSVHPGRPHRMGSLRADPPSCSMTITTISARSSAKSCAPTGSR